MNLKKCLTGIAALGYLFLGSGSAYAGNTVPTIKGFINPQVIDDPKAKRYLNEISVIKGNPLTTKLVVVQDPDGDKTKLNLDSVLKVIQLKDGTLKKPVNVRKDGHFFYIPDAGNYELNFSATDGKASARRTIDVIVRDSRRILNDNEQRIYEAIKGKEILLRELAGYSSFDFAELTGLLGAESDFKEAVSNKKARTWAQITEQGRQGFGQLYRLNRKILDTALDISKAEKLKIGKDYLNLSKIDLKSLGFTDSRFNLAKKKYRQSLTENELLHVILPQYLKMKELFPDGQINRWRLNSDRDYSAKAMAAIMEVNYIELSSLQVISEEVKDKKGKKETVYSWVYRPREHFLKHPQTKAFDKEDAFSAYNTGLGGWKRKMMTVVKEGRYNPMREAVDETKDHRVRHQRYIRAIEELEKKLEQNCYYHQMIKHSID